ncbi:MAG: hypothetical protein LC780_03100 [Acidobacteria bacterium]|nr:hypothetical protein [Acidobacteriota bacterium]
MNVERSAGPGDREPDFGSAKAATLALEVEELCHVERAPIGPDPGAVGEERAAPPRRSLTDGTELAEKQRRAIRRDEPGAGGERVLVLPEKERHRQQRAGSGSRSVDPHGNPEGLLKRRADDGKVGTRVEGMARRGARRVVKDLSQKDLVLHGVVERHARFLANPGRTARLRDALHPKRRKSGNRHVAGRRYRNVSPGNRRVPVGEVSRQPLDDRRRRRP